MAKYDNTGDVKRRRFPLFLTIFIIGIVLFIVGVVLIKVTNTKSLGKRYSYNETFEVATIDNMEIDFSAGDLNIKKSHQTASFRSRPPTAFCTLKADISPLTEVSLR